MRATDIVAYTFDADIYCPPCIAKMFDLNLSVGIEASLSATALLRGIDYSDEYSYDSGDFPKVIFASQANDGEWEHCANMYYPISTVDGVCEQHIAHDARDCEEDDTFEDSPWYVGPTEQ